MAYIALSILVFVSVIFCIGQLLEPVKIQTRVDKFF